MLNVNKRVNFNNFGYLPSGGFLKDFYGKLFGNPNLTKRLQVKAIFNILNLKSSDVALDLGCGSGFMTVEMSKMTAITHGIDISPTVKLLRVPTKLKDKLEFHHYDGSKLPFEANTFNLVLSSEVIGQVPDTSLFLQEIKRVLKPQGRLILVNGCGHPLIEEAYRDKNELYKEAERKYKDKMPPSYSSYCAILNKDFDNLDNGFLSEEDIDLLLKKNDFSQISINYSPKKTFGSDWSKNMFFKYLKTGETYKKSWVDYLTFIYKYHYYNRIQQTETEVYKNGLIYEARNNK